MCDETFNTILYGLTLVWVVLLVGLVKMVVDDYRLIRQQEREDGGEAAS